MKQILLCCLVLSFAITSQAQYADTSRHTVATDYFKKSKNQKTAAWILLGSGGVAFVTGFVIYRNSIKNSNNPFEFLKGKGAGVSALGFLAMAGSIPLFIAAGKNRRKGEASISFKMENSAAIYQWAVSNKLYPTVAIQVRL